MRNLAYYRGLLQKPAFSTVGASLAAAAVYAARYGLCEAEDRDSAAYRAILRDLMARYGESLTAAKVLAEMTRPEGELLARADIAQLAGVEPGTVSKWIQRHRDFPAPVARTSAGDVWRREDAVAWLLKTGRYRLE